MWLIFLTSGAVTFMLMKGKHTNSNWFHKSISLNKFQSIPGNEWLKPQA